MTETPDDLLEPDVPPTATTEADVEPQPPDEDDDPGLSAEKSLGLLPPD